MNKRHIGPMIFIAMITFTTFFAIRFSFVPRDFSWIVEVENWIKRENLEPDREYIPLTIAVYIRGLVNDVDRRLDYVSREFLDEILAEDRVLKLVLRFPVEFGFFNKFGAAFFVLEDKLDLDLEGTIVVYDTSGRYSVWEIADWFF